MGPNGPDNSPVATAIEVGSLALCFCVAAVFGALCALKAGVNAVVCWSICATIVCTLVVVAIALCRKILIREECTDCHCSTGASSECTGEDLCRVDVCTAIIFQNWTVQDYGNPRCPRCDTVCVGPEQEPFCTIAGLPCKEVLQCPAMEDTCDN